MLVQISYFQVGMEHDWRISAMQFLEYKIVCTACSRTIPGYSNEDLAQELRSELWSKLPLYDPDRSGIKTWANLVMKSHLNHLNNKATKTKKRKDYLCESIHDLAI